MLVKGEGLPQNDLDSFRGYLSVGSPIMISIILGDICLMGRTFSACYSFLYGIFHHNDYPILNPKHHHFQNFLFSLFIL